jgi:hypothetical protein
MWWDIIPVYGRPKDPTRKEMDQEILGVLESALQLNAIACQESALHGLGHWQVYYPDQTREIIARFLQGHKEIREDLRLYAMSASSGHVL